MWLDDTAATHCVMGHQFDPWWGNPLNYFSYLSVLHNWCNKDCGIYYILSCVWVCAYKRSLAANQKEYPLKWWQSISSLAIFQPVLHDWCNKGHGMCYPVRGMVYTKEPLLLNGKSSPCGNSRFPLTI